MLNPNMFMKLAQSSSASNKKIEIQKLSGYLFSDLRLDRTRWDEPFEVPPILYQKFNLPVPSTPQVHHTHPQQLIDFIGKAYNKCKDHEQKKIMELELKDIINKHSANLHAVDWTKYPVPNISSYTLAPTEKNPVSSHQYPGQPTIGFDSTKRTLQRQTIYLPTSEHKSAMLHKIQKERNLPQSKTKQIINKKLQQLKLKYEQGLDNTQTRTQNSVPQKTFTGFRDQRDVRLEMHRQRYEQLTMQNQIANQPIPPPPFQKVQSPQSSLPSFTSLPPQINQPLQVVQSRMPQKIQQPTKSRQQKSENTKKNQTQQKKESIASTMTKEELQSIVRAGKQEGIRTVAKRFTQFHRVKGVKQVPVEQEEDQDFEDITIIGKCTKLDKPYLRITHRPDPQTVRPETILRKAFNHFKAEYKKNTPYDQIISQFRSIRQDLTVQNIRNSFTVEVYEQNFRMSLFEDDTIQMKQCQTNLWQLYRQGLYNKRSDRTRFVGYQFIVMILQERYKELAYMLTQIPPEILQEKIVQDSLTQFFFYCRLKKFLVVGNYHAFFSFYNSQDETCQKLMNHYIDKVRIKFLVMACKTFGEKISFSYLGQNCAEDEDVLEAFAKEQGATVNDGCIHLKESYEKLKNSDYLQVKKVTSLLD